MQLEIRKKFYYTASVGLFCLMVTQAYQLIRHVQIMHELPQAMEVTELETHFLHEKNRIILEISDDLRKKKTQYPVTWFNPISKVFVDTERTTHSFISMTFLGINFTYPSSFFVFHLIEMTFSLLLFFYCFFNRRHYTSQFFDENTAFTSLLNFESDQLCSVTSPSIRVAKNRQAERWYLFRDEKKLGPYTLEQVEYLVHEKTNIKDFMCMSTYDHRVYKVKNIINRR